MKRLLRFFKSRDDRFLSLLSQQASYAVEATEILLKYMQKPGEKFAVKARTIEKEADEDIGLILVRTYTLKEVGPTEATFDVAITFESDPDRPSAREKTTCTISGNGRGEAAFNLEHGVFTMSKMSSDLIFDIAAPLKKLPTHAEGFDPGLGTTRIELVVQMGGKRVVNRLFGESEKPASAAD